MDPILEIASDAMRHDAVRLSTLASNLANLNTAGYRRELAVRRAGPGTIAAFDQVFAQGMADAGIVRLSVARDARQGTLRATGEPLDLALESPGYFEVETDAGPAYTREGHFRIDAGGRLVDMQGHRVLGRGGRIVLSGSDVVVSAAGQVRASGRIVDDLRVVDFPAASDLAALGKGLYRSTSPKHAVEPPEIRVRQGYLENSNVDVAREMVSLVQTMRHFESMHRVVQAYDDMMATALRRLGDA